jgi:hypothetical protein
MPQSSDKGKYRMESLWNSLEVVNTIRLLAQWTVPIAAIIALVFTMRFTTLKNADDAVRAIRDSDEKIHLKEAIDSAHSEAKDAKQQALSKQAEVEALHTKLAEAEKRISKTEIAVKPIPLSERLRQLLSIIDPKILPALKAGNTNFSGGITSTQFNDLQKLAKEPGADRFIIVSSDVKMGVGMGPEGITYGVQFTLNPRLLKE